GSEGQGKSQTHAVHRMSPKGQDERSRSLLRQNTILNKRPMWKVPPKLPLYAALFKAGLLRHSLRSFFAITVENPRPALLRHREEARSANVEIQRTMLCNKNPTPCHWHDLPLSLSRLTASHDTA